MCIHILNKLAKLVAHCIHAYCLQGGDEKKGGARAQESYVEIIIKACMSTIQLATFQLCTKLNVCSFCVIPCMHAGMHGLKSC